MQTQHININDYNYPLPDERIAKYPLQERDSSRLLVSHNDRISTHMFRELPSLLPENSLLVVNDTRVIQARLHFRKATGARIEVFLLEPHTPADYEQMFQACPSCTWSCLIGNVKKWKEEPLSIDFTHNGQQVTFTAKRGSATNDGCLVHFSWTDQGLTFGEIIDILGELPIPPYLNRHTEETDKTTYQTIYSRIKGSVAAPTAGLHFTGQVLTDLRKQHITTAKVTLHVGAGTFRPVKTDEIGLHIMHAEHISVSRDTLLQIVNHLGNIVAVGTTSVRTMESLYYIGCKIKHNPHIHPSALHVEQWEPYTHVSSNMPTADEALYAIVDYLDRNQMQHLQTTTRIIIAPGYKYHYVNALITNFHQPKSTLLLLVSAFVGEKWRTIYEYALKNSYRFLSYGDSSLLFP